MIASQRHPASFRDPSGYVFEKDGQIYRQVNKQAVDDYRLLMESGLYQALQADKMLVAHTGIPENFTGEHDWYTTLAPERIGFISFPYEWCFSEWRQAAILTLDVLRKSLEYGMVLKDATPFNIQFNGTAPIFIDTLSFEKYDPTQPWVAYRQFMECFVAPLLLAKYRGAEMLGLFALYPEGIPLPQLSRMLPAGSRFNLNVFLHVFLAGMVSRQPAKANAPQPSFSKQKLLNITGNLRSWVASLEPRKNASHWSKYYDETILSDAYAQAKMEIVRAWMTKSTQRDVLDMGTNTGWFALAAADMGKQVIAADADTDCIEALYRSSGKRSNLLPLVLDITRPSPAIGWQNEERGAFLQRVRPGLTLALALVHHLAITHHIGFDQLARLFAGISEELIIEFVPKSDPKVQLLLTGRKHIFTLYNEDSFRAAFETYWMEEDRTAVTASSRILYYLKRRPL